MELTKLGWNSSLSEQFSAHADHGWLPARIALERRKGYTALCERGSIRAVTAGRLHHRARNRAELPAVGDWVALDFRKGGKTGLIQAVLPRKTAFTRKVPGSVTEEQVLAANVDVCMLLCGLDEDYSLERIERYLARTREAGAQPVIVLNKADLADKVDDMTAEVRDAVGAVPVHAVSGTEGWRVDELRAYLGDGSTVAFLGSSGVGKSTLINALLGEQRQVVGDVRSYDGRGRHTTSHRELIPTAGGALFMDMPGLREIQLWDDHGGVNESFDDIGELAVECRFNDCTHRAEPGCAVRTAVEEGRMDGRRYHNFLKLQEELGSLRERRRKRHKRVEKALWRRRSTASIARDTQQELEFEADDDEEGENTDR
jgi:ribosome biogenesis GTPase